MILFIYSSQLEGKDRDMVSQSVIESFSESGSKACLAHASLCPHVKVVTEMGAARQELAESYRTHQCATCSHCVYSTTCQYDGVLCGRVVRQSASKVLIHQCNSLLTGEQFLYLLLKSVLNFFFRNTALGGCIGVIQHIAQVRKQDWHNLCRRCKVSLSIDNIDSCRLATNCPWLNIFRV